MHIAVVDDEEVLRHQMYHMIKKQKPDFAVSSFATGEELLASENTYDIIFLDICMEGINGIDTAKNLREKSGDAIVIFITGRKEYVFEAFDVSAFHYLLKPIEEQKFMEVFDRALREVGKKKGQEERQIFVRTKSQGFMLNVNRILYVESRSKKVGIHTADSDEVIEAYTTMNELEVQLGHSFYRCHRGYLVNMAHILRYDNDSITLSGGEKVYLTRKKHSGFVKAYMWYLQNGGVSFV